jgi:hypothetical protein
MLSNRFGVKIGKVDESFFDAISVNEGISSFREEKLDLVVARIDLTRLDLINQLEKRGFVTKDVQCTLRNVFKDRHGDLVFNKVEREDGYVLREFKESDVDGIVDIAKRSFIDYGHFAADKRLDSKDCLDAYVDWAYNSCVNEEVATKVFVATKEHEVAAFIAYKKFVDGGKTYAAGVLGGVNPDHRKKGLFPDIDITALEWGIENEFDWEEHNVLMDNFPVMKSHMSVGFRPQKSMVTLHGWLDEIRESD